VRYIQELSPRQRDLLALKFTAELSNRQIAEMTGLTEQNVGVILHRSIRKLRRRMELAEGCRAR
jgi:RNA polymerase sigma-70 factor (ECF subfamily)